MSAIEWALIRGVAPDVNPTSREAELAKKVIEADFKSVLLSPEASTVLSSTPGIWEGLYPTTPRPASSTSTSRSVSDSGLLQLIVAIALLHSYVQINWTGPDLPFSPRDILPSSNSSDSLPSLDDLDQASIPLLTLHGEPAYHLSSHPSLLILALRVFDSVPSTIITRSWWRLRAHLVHLSLLDETVDLDPAVTQELKDLRSHLLDEEDTQAIYELELGLLQHALGQDKLANQEFLAAARASGLKFELTGALGKKTKYQVNALSQLVLLAESRPRAGDEASADVTKESVPETMALNDDTLLEETEFTKLSTPAATATPSASPLAHLDPADQPALYPLDQSLLLSLCLSQHNNEPSSGLLASQMMPFLSRVVSHPRNWSVHTTALLLRSRLEAHRSRTVERSALQLQALIEQMPTSDSAPAERLRWFHQIPLPSKWEMERELAKRFLSLGVVRSALDIFTRLEMWEDAVACLQRMERENEAETIVKDLLAGRKIESDLVTVMAKDISESRRSKLTAGREAKLWCLLGDIALTSTTASQDPIKARDEATGHYDKAWEVSGHTSARSRRSLGSLRFSQRDYEGAILCLRDAVAINPLFARAWFTMGVCLVRLERWNEAKEAFRRQVGVEEDDGEGWNNLAAVYLRLDEEGLAKDQPPPPASFENKLLAFRALRQGLRYARNNWRMWTNYMIVSIDVGELSEAARALTRVIEERAGIDGVNSIDMDVLDKLVDGVTLDDWNLSKDGTVVPKTSNEGFGLLPIVERLFDMTILTRISDSPRVWRAHARLLRWKEDWEGALDDYVRAYRFGPANDQKVETDLERFKEGVQEVVDLVDIYQALGPRIKREEGVKKGDWRFAARGVVRTFIGRTRSSFEDQPEMEQLKEVLDDLKKSE